MITAISIVLAVVSSLLGATGMLFFKLGSKKVSLKIKDWVTNWRVILGLFLYVVALVSLIIAMKSGDLSIVYPLYAFSYVWVAFYSKRFLKEKISWVNWAGIFVIVLGIALTSIK